ncbi:hypothetical protein N8203_03475, partial [Crocinitomicaceae bacterium]|nr:hypothetical protein [Crocinitomicaceae bacterium]
MKVNCLVSLITCAIVIYSCGGSDDQDIIRYEDIGVRDNYNVSNDSMITDSNQSIANTFDLANLEIKVDKVIEVKTNEFLDRFENIKDVKRLIITPNDSTYFKSWTFEDSTDTFNAFYNLLDYFGNNYVSIELYSDEFMSSTYHLLFVSENQIHWVLSNKNQDKLVWEAYLKS